MQRVRVSSQQSPVQKLGESQLTLSPKFRLGLSNSCWPDPSSDLQLAMNGQPLVPGLPDDVALNCLLRLPVETHRCCRAVCKRWHLLLSSKAGFFTMRKELGFKDPWLFVYAFSRCTQRQREVQWQVLDLTHFTWHTIPSMPCNKKVSPQGFKCVSIPKQGTLFVCGGMISDADCPLDLVFKYEVYKNRWSVLKQMKTARSFFAGGVIDGTVYVAGGNSADLFELDSGEALEPSNANWRSISRMGADMASYDSAVLDGKLLVTEGWLWPFFVSPRGQVYDPKTDNWENMAVGLREGWTGSSVVVYGHLFVVSEHERMKLKVYHKESDSWDKVEGPPLPEQICKPFSVNSCDSRIYVVGRSLHVALGFISSCSNQRGGRGRGPGQGPGQGFSVRWKVVHAPHSVSHFAPSTSQVIYA